MSRTPANLRSSAREAHDRRRPPPELFQAVVLPLFRREDVHDQVDEIQEHPAAIRRTLLVAKVVALFSEFAFQVAQFEQFGVRRAATAVSTDCAMRAVAGSVASARSAAFAIMGA